jgi:hypothetical protein
MGSVLVVMPSPRLDQDLRIHQIAVPLHAQAFVPELAVEALIGAVLPQLTRIDMSNVDALGQNPLPYRSGKKFRPVVRSRHPRCTVNAHQQGKHLNDTAGADTRGHIDGQAFPCVLVRDRQTLDLPTIGACVVHEVVRPDLASTGWRQWSGTPPCNALSGPFPGHLQPCLAQEPEHPVQAHLKTPRHVNMDPSVSKSRIARRELPQGSQHMRILQLHLGAVAQRRSCHQQQRTRPAQRQATSVNVLDLRPTNACAHHFFAATPLMTSMSRSRSRRRSSSASRSRLQACVVGERRSHPVAQRLRRKYIVCSLTPCFLLTSATSPLSASHRIRTICSSVTLPSS